MYDAATIEGWGGVRASKYQGERTLHGGSAVSDNFSTGLYTLNNLFICIDSYVGQTVLGLLRWARSHKTEKSHGCVSAA